MRVNSRNLTKNQENIQFKKSINEPIKKAFLQSSPQTKLFNTCGLLGFTMLFKQRYQFVYSLYLNETSHNFKHPCESIPDVSQC